MPLCIVVEDHGDTRDAYVEFLGLSGFTVLTAGTGPELQALLAANAPDVIVMDLQLPGTDGWTLIGQLKADKSVRHVPILVVSAAVREKDRQEAFRAGAAAFVPKPCDPTHVVDELKRLITHATPGKNDLG